MRRWVAFLSVLLALCIMVSAAPSHKKRTWVLERTYTGPVAYNPQVVHNATFGYAAEAFIPDCEVWFYGRMLDPVPAPDGANETGVFIKKTATDVTINGHDVFMYKKPKQPAHPPSSATRMKSEITGEAIRQLRLKAKPDNERAGAYVVDGKRYEQNVPTPYTLDGRDITVMVTVTEDYLNIEYEGWDIGFPLHPLPKPTQAEQDEQRLDVVYNGLVGDCRPGRIVIMGSGVTYVFPQRMRAQVRDALKRIPDLAVPTSEDYYGEMMYEMIKIGEITFDSGTIKDFLKATGR